LAEVDDSFSSKGEDQILRHKSIGLTTRKRMRLTDEVINIVPYVVNLMGDTIYSPDGKWLWNGTEWTPVSNPSSIETDSGDQNDLDEKTSPEKAGFWNDIVSNSDQEVVIDSRSVSQKIKDMEDEIRRLEQETNPSDTANLNTAKQLMAEGKWKEAKRLAWSIRMDCGVKDSQMYAQASFLEGKCGYMIAVSESDRTSKKSILENSEGSINIGLREFTARNDEESVLECMVVLKDIAQLRHSLTIQEQNASSVVEAFFDGRIEEVRGKMVSEIVGELIHLSVGDEEYTGEITEFDNQGGTVSIYVAWGNKKITGYQENMTLAYGSKS